MFSKIYQNVIIKKPKFTLLILAILLLNFGYFTKNFQLDASSDTLLLENDPDLKYLREVNTKYGSKDFLVLTYTPEGNLLAPNTFSGLCYCIETNSSSSPIHVCLGPVHIFSTGTCRVPEGPARLATAL